MSEKCVIFKDTKSFCPTCRKTVDLLAAPKPGPEFYVCWPCRWVGQIGVGPVKREGV